MFTALYSRFEAYLITVSDNRRSDTGRYWVWEAIDGIKPAVVIVEYNSVFGPDRAITIPYTPGFQRTRAHYSNLYYGASLRALDHLARSKGYAFIGGNSAGNNAYFVRRDTLNACVTEVPVEAGYTVSKVRESRDPRGRLTYASGRDRLPLIAGLDVINVLTGQPEKL